jgi:hypothetical protein
MSESADEDLIEATIRRVAAARAALDAQATELGGPDTPSPAVDDAIAHAEASADGVGLDAIEPAPVDESLIEATIRRVAAEKAAREGAQTEPDSTTADPPEHFDEDAIEETIRPVAAQGAEREEEPAVPTQTAAPPQPADAGLAQIERNLAHAAARVEAVAERLDQAVAIIERLARDLPAFERSGNGTESEWDDDPPQISRLPMSGAPRPPIMRDPSPQTATAKHLEPDRIDTRPIPEPPPPLHVETRRGVDLLPRSYRITVEDKRRGVDLVPLHRALLGLEGVKDMSLLSYNSGIAIVSLDTAGELDSEELRLSVSRAMSRDARVEVHNEHTMVIKLAEE